MKALPPLVLAAALAVASAAPAFADDVGRAGVIAEPRGALVIIGGSERFRDRELWDEIVSLAGGDGAKIAILPMAAGRRVGRLCEQVVQAFERSGAVGRVVPVEWGGSDRSARDGVRMGRELDHGLGFLDPDWFVEQHCLVRGRFARALVAMRSQEIPYGIGVDENTAFVVRRGRYGTVIGYKGVLIMDASSAEVDEDVEEFNLSNVVLSYLDRGDAIDLHTLRVTPAAEKIDETPLDPNADDFAPYYDHRMVYTDVLGNATVADLMGRLIDNEESEAIGLAFSAADARDQPAEGFEFRFYRGPESRGWYTESFGGEDYTVLNIHLDIRPIAIAGPLYTRRPAREVPGRRGDEEPHGEADDLPGREVDAARE